MLLWELLVGAVLFEGGCIIELLRSKLERCVFLFGDCCFDVFDVVGVVL